MNSASSFAMFLELAKELRALRTRLVELMAARPGVESGAVPPESCATSEVATVFKAIGTILKALIELFERSEFDFDDAFMKVEDAKDLVGEAGKVRDVVDKVIKELDRIYPVIDVSKMTDHPVSGGPLDVAQGQTRMKKNEFERALAGHSDSRLHDLEFWIDTDSRMVTFISRETITVSRSTWVILGVLYHMAKTCRSLTTEGWVKRSVLLGIVKRILLSDATDHGLDSEMCRFRERVDNCVTGLDPVQSAYGMIRLDLQREEKPAGVRTDPVIHTMFEGIMKVLDD
ncbi:MAG: hypothetical protein C0404_05370 [Verrucomicrobia bacterium]|nr:hypothetical protein [Verrucomicrobiota bacterium]